MDPRDLAEDPAAHLGDKGADGKRVRRCGGTETCSACRFDAVAREVSRDVLAAANALVGALWRADLDAIDAFRLEHGRDPKGKEWPIPALMLGTGAYQFLRARIPSVQSGIASALARDITRKWGQVRFDVLIRGIKAPQFYKIGFPIPVRAQDFGLRLLDDGRYSLAFSLHAGVKGGREFQLRLLPRDEKQHQIFALMGEARAKIGAMQIMEDPKRRGRWYARIAYTRIVPRSTGLVTAAINRGCVCFLAAVTSTGKTRLYDGYDIEATLKRIQARRRQYQHDGRWSGGRGHGTDRALRMLRHLEGKGERWRADRCQKIARSFVRWLVEQGVGLLYMEDLAGIRDEISGVGWKPAYIRIQEWPYYQLGQRIASCCAEVGIEVRERAAEYVSQRCPRCGHTNEANMDLPRRRFRCVKCKHGGHLDLVAASNLLIAGDVERLSDRMVSGGARTAEGSETAAVSGSPKAPGGRRKARK